MVFESPRRSLLVLTAAFLAACTAQLPEAADHEADPSTVAEAPEAISPRVHKMPLNDGSGPVLYSAPAGSHLTYYGGRINGSTKVVQVLWGSGSYLSNVSSTATPSIATFYQQMLSKTTLNTFLDNEYNTVSPSGTKTNQHFTAGAFQSQVTITPSVTGSTISDAQIQSELTAQIAAGHLPAPALDAQGNAVTYYAIFFPPGKTITQGGSSSCVSGGFCAYHGTVAAGGGHNEYYYGVHPDMQAGSGCATGCGNSTTFGNYTSVASHELVEMMTDAEVGIAPNLAAPLAWYDNTNGEIGDICNAQQGTIAACDGSTYTYQLEFSNAQSNCIGWTTSCGTSTNDFSIAASPASGSVTAGGSASSTISTATTAGVAQTVSLSVSGAPAGVTASLSPTSVSSGQSATLSITTTTSAAAGTYTLTVTGTATSGSHSTSYALTVSGGSGGGNVLTNGVAKTGLSGATGAQQTFTLSVPAGQTSLAFALSGGTGDADMYVKFGSAPTLSTYDCRPYVSGNTENCNFTNPAAGTWYVMLNGYAAYSGVSLKGTYAGGSGGGDPYLTNGVAVTNISGATGSNQYWRLSVPAGSTATFVTSGGTGDADLYVQKGARPTLTSYACRPYVTGNNETCNLTNTGTAAADYYVMLNGYAAFTGVSLKGTHP